MLTNPAYLGSWCQTKKLIQKLLGNDGVLLDNISSNERNLQTLQDVAETHGRLSALAVSLHSETVPELDRLQQLKSKAQRALTNLLYCDLDRQMDEVAADNVRDKARLNSCKGYGASAWLTAIPKLPLYRLEPAEFRTALRLRLGMEQPPIFITTPCGGCKRHSVDAFGDHYLSCTRGGNHLAIRHDRVVDAFAAMMRTAGHITRTTNLTDIITQTDTVTGSRLRPDIVALGWHEDGRDVCLDVAVTHPTAATYVDGAAETPLHAATQREIKKDSKYLAACTADGMAFSPLVFESYGAFGTRAHAVLKAAVKKIAAKLPDDAFSKMGVHTWTASSFRSYFMQRISIGL